MKPFFTDKSVPTSNYNLNRIVLVHVWVFNFSVSLVVLVFPFTFNRLTEVFMQRNLKVTYEPSNKAKRRHLKRRAMRRNVSLS